MFKNLLPKVTEFGRIVSVILLMDMRTRFGSSYFGYLIAIVWPLSHLIFISGAYLLRTYVAPVGESPAVFVATGVVPYILCLYPARMLGMAVIQGRALLNMPIIKPEHLIAARWILEVLNAFIVLGLYLLLMYSFDIDFLPADSLIAAQAIFAVVYLGIGFGLTNTVACAIFGPMFLFAFTLFTVILYILSGAYEPSSRFTEEMREYYSYNPLFQIVEWLRSAYYTNYDPYLVDKAYVIEVASVSLALGLLGKRFLRGKFYS
jgi:capsular polysaccharide transport system permease protein